MKEKFYHISGKAVDSNGITHHVTVVGKRVRETVHGFEEETVYNESGSEQGVLMFKVKNKLRRFTMGYAICHPDDEFNEEIGINLAKRRIETDPIGTIESYNVTMLNDDQNEMMVLIELAHIIKNIDKYIGK